jgi:hypothetical protein
MYLKLVFQLFRFRSLFSAKINTSLPRHFTTRNINEFEESVYLDVRLGFIFVSWNYGKNNVVFR